MERRQALLLMERDCTTTRRPDRLHYRVDRHAQAQEAELRFGL